MTTGDASGAVDQEREMNPEYGLDNRLQQKTIHSIREKFIQGGGSLTAPNAQEALAIFAKNEVKKLSADAHSINDVPGELNGTPIKTSSAEIFKVTIPLTEDIKDEMTDRKSKLPTGDDRANMRDANFSPFYANGEGFLYGAEDQTSNIMVDSARVRPEDTTLNVYVTADTYKTIVDKAINSPN